MEGCEGKIMMMMRGRESKLSKKKEKKKIKKIKISSKKGGCGAGGEPFLFK